MVFWRAKIGLINPGIAPTGEHDFNRYAPDGVGISTIRVPWGQSGGGPTPENLKMMASGLKEGCLQYIDPRIKQDVIIFACTSGSLIGGPTFDKECIKIIEDTTGSKGMTTSTAILMAFEALGAKRVVVLAPYPDDTNEAEKVFLEKNGIEVPRIVGMNPNRQYIPSIDPAYVYQQAKQLDTSGADAVFISCTGLDALSVIKPLEEDFGLSVVTSNQASLWACLRAAQVGTKLPQLGKLCTL